MNLGTLRTAVKARGFDDLTDAQVNQLVNDACVELDAMFPWPYREKSVTGSPAPLEIPDLGEVDVVLDLDNGSYPLQKRSWDEISADYGDTGTAGTPEFWYVASPAGVLQIGTYPTSTHTIGVEYWALTATLSSDSDTPLAPAAWHGLIVDIAAGAAYPDGDTPPGLQARIDRRVNAMVGSLMSDYGPTFVLGDGVDS